MRCSDSCVNIENSKEKFAVKMILTRDEGSMFYYGSVETGMNIDGSVGTNDGFRDLRLNCLAVII